MPEASHDLRVARAAAEQAAEFIRRASRDIQTTYKTRGDIVTNVDIAAERLIIERLRGAFPQDGVVSEEAGILPGQTGRTWCVDPLDGTANFANGVPHFAVAIALREGGSPLLAVTVDVAREETFVATSDSPTTRHDLAITLRPAGHIEDSLLALQLPEPAWRADSRMERAVHSSRGVRVSGSMALDFAWTAAGLLDVCLYRRRPSLWDWVGGELLVTQAGGEVACLGAIGEHPVMAVGAPAVVAALAALGPWRVD